MPAKTQTFIVRVVDQATKQLRKIESQVGLVAKRFIQLSGAGIALGTAALVKFGRDSIVAADNINKLSAQLGIGTEALSEYQFVAERAGIQFSQFATGIQRALRRISQAADGTGEAVDVIKELGLNAEDLENMRPDRAFELLLKQLSKVPGEFDRIRIAQKLFDSEGVNIIRLLDQTGGSIDDIRRKARELGVSFSEDFADKASEAVDAAQELKAAFSGLGKVLANEAAPAFTEFVNTITTKLVSVARLIEIINRVGLSDFASALVLGGDALAAIESEAFDAQLAVARLEDQLKRLKKERSSFLGRSDSIVDDDIADVEKRLLEARAQLEQALSEPIKIGAIEGDLPDVALANAAVAGDRFAAAIHRLNIGLTEIEVTAQRIKEVDFFGQNVVVDPAALETINQLKDLYAETRIPAEELAEKILLVNENLDLLTKAGIDADDVIRRLGEAYAQAADETDKLVTVQVEVFNSIRSTANAVGRDLVGVFTDSTKSIGDVFKNMAERVISDLLEILVIQRLVNAALGAFGIPITPGRQHGGPVFPGQPVIVGEGGPELFVPQSSGRIEPGAGGPVSVNFTINSLDPRTAASVIAENEQVIVGVVQRAFNRQGINAGLA